MAETRRMTAEQVVAYLLEGEGLDFLRESLASDCQQLMEAKVSELVGAAAASARPRNGLRIATATAARLAEVASREPGDWSGRSLRVDLRCR